jgi:sortase A
MTSMTVRVKRVKRGIVLERMLLGVGLICVTWYAFALAHARYDEYQATATVERMLESAGGAEGAAGGASVVTSPIDSRTPGTSGTFAEGALGVLEIPRLGVSVPVVEGDDTDALRGAAGHLPDTPHPWENGNSAIAGHRDGLFRPLRHIRVGDEVRVRTPHGPIRYRVKDTHIVQPTDLSVLQPTAGSTLTLITCYPFYYVGAAPQRFIVHADRVN